MSPTSSPPLEVLPPEGVCRTPKRIGSSHYGSWVRRVSAGLVLTGLVSAQDVTPTIPPPPPPRQPAEATTPPANTATPTTPADATVPTTPAAGATVPPADPSNALLPDIPPGGVLPFGVKDIEKRKSVPYREASRGEISSEVEEALDEVSHRRISLMEAVEIALLNDPVIRIAEEEVAIARASRMIARGSFDPRLSTGVTYERRKGEISEAEVAQQQQDLDRNKALVLATRKERKKLQAEINQLESGQNPANATKEGQLQDDLTQAALDLLEELGLAAGLDVSALNDIAEEIQKQGIETRKSVLDTLESTEKNARKQIKQFPVNSIRVTETTEFDLSIIKQFRNGLVLAPYLEYDNAQNNLSRRSGARRLNQSEIGIDFTIPLARGRGTIAASGHEMAAQIDVEASQLSLQHTVAERVLAVVQAYWQMAAAQEQLEYLVRSEITTTALLGLTQGLIQADEVPAAMASQSIARRAEATASRIRGEITLEQAQQNLAILMGVEGEDIVYAPLASDPLPAIIPERTVKSVSLPNLVERAFAQRADYRASRKVIDSGKLLTEQARLNVKPRVDLALSGFYTGRDSDGSRDGYYHLFLENQAGLGFSVSLRMDWPFFLHEAKGTYGLRLADLETRREQMRLINHQIVSGITQTHFELRLTARQLGQQSEAVAQYERALATEREGFRLGISTMIDTIQTEERLTLARAELVFTKLQHALSLARLRFETGTLMPHDHLEHTRVTRANFVTLPVFGPDPVDDAIAPRSGVKEVASKVLGETDPHRVLQKLNARDRRAASRAGTGVSEPPPRPPWTKSGK